MATALSVLLATAAAALAPLDPRGAPTSTIAVTRAHDVRIAVPEDDAIMEAFMASAHAAALAAGEGRYDEVMEEYCTAQPQQYWAQLWPSSYAMSRWMLDEPTLVAGKTVLELGCGLGLSAVCAALAGAERVHATDREEPALHFAAHNAATNGVGDRVSTGQLDWAEASTAELDAPYDVVLAADVIYDESAAALLHGLLPTLVKPHGGVLLLADNADRPYKAERRTALLDLLEADGFACVGEQRAVAVELETRLGRDFEIVLAAMERSES